MYEQDYQTKKTESRDYIHMKDIKKSISAGMMIGIGSTVYLICPNKILGAFLFTLGLFVICSFGMHLFTGKVGYILENKNNPNCIKIWIGNLIGCLTVVIPMRLAKGDISSIAYDLVQKKLEENFISALILSVFCGFLMYIAVENFQSNKNDFAKIVGLFVCVPTFIICGFEHSIANMCYCIFSIDTLSMGIKAFIFILINSVGNTFGAVLLRYMTKN